MIKKISLFILAIFVSISLFSKVSPSQDKKNIKFLKQLDKNLVNTIKMIGTFNKVANKIPSKVKGLGHYRRFLMDMTIETGKLRTNIKTALKKKDPQLREIIIRDMIISIDNNVKPAVSVSEEEDNYNYHFLKDIKNVYDKRLVKIRKNILAEEKNIKKNAAFTKVYFNLHTKNYIYSLLLNFISIHKYLTKKNRQNLVNVIKAIEDEANKKAP